MDEYHYQWLKGKPNWWFRYKRKVIGGAIDGSCLNIGCGHHLIKGAKNTEEDATQLKYKNRSFDTVVLADVLEHIKDDKTALHKAIGIAKKRVVITVPVHPWLFSEYDELLGHKRRYRKRDFDGLKRMYDLDTRFLYGALFPLFVIRKLCGLKRTPRLWKPIDSLFYAAAHLRLPWGTTLFIILHKQKRKT